MVPSLLARVDGLPVTLLDRKVVWPTATSGRDGRRRPLPRGRRARIERETAVVHAAVLPAWARHLVAERADGEGLELRAELERAGLL